MTLYAGQVLRVDQTSGECSATYLTVTDDDLLLQSAEAGTIWNLCGDDMAAPPVLDVRQVTGTLLDGTAFAVTALHFAARGKDFYLVPNTFAPDGVAAVATSVTQGTPTPTNYFTLGQTIDDTPLLAGQALAVRFNANGKAQSSAVVGALVTDDDSLVQFDASETGEAAQITFGPTYGAILDFNSQDIAARQMVLVKVFYHGATADGSFTALRLSAPAGNGTQAWYLPKLGQVDLADVISYTREKPLSASAEGLDYSAFGLTQDRLRQQGTALADFLQGGPLHDELLGGTGADSLTGGLGADRLEGGNDNDALHGGAQNDTMIGGAGDDDLYGGNDDDAIYGNDGNDSFLGAWGDDQLFGGAGNDRLGAGSDNDLLFGGSGNDSLIGFADDDRLEDGTGVDTLNGGSGADVFVLVADGATDRIVDFEDGIDRLSLPVAFADLTITTLSPGHLRIAWGAEVLLLDGAGRSTLTAADLTTADFL